MKKHYNVLVHNTHLKTEEIESIADWILAEYNKTDKIIIKEKVKREITTNKNILADIPYMQGVYCAKH